MSAVISETRAWDVGPYRVQQRPRFDNPAFAVYIVSRGERLIGKSFSLPDLGCCEWLERHGGLYADASAGRSRKMIAHAARGRAAERHRARLAREEASEPAT